MAAGYTLPRYKPRLFVEVTITSSADEGEGDTSFWFAQFSTPSVFTAGWPLVTGKKRLALGPLGLPEVRTR